MPGEEPSQEAERVQRLDRDEVPDGGHEEGRQVRAAGEEGHEPLGNERMADGLLEGERGLLAKIQGYETLSNGLKRALVSSENTAELMGMMVNDTGLRNKLGNNACKWAKDYTWSHISREFDKILIAS